MPNTQIGDHYDTHFQSRSKAVKDNTLIFTNTIFLTFNITAIIIFHLIVEMLPYSLVKATPRNTIRDT